jgi:hypothetical protein
MGDGQGCHLDLGMPRAAHFRRTGADRLGTGNAEGGGRDPVVATAPFEAY